MKIIFLSYRYFKPEDPRYHSPIFLDCCGLVRQVVYDLREDFGFTLSRWNQGYQIDTLPNEVKFEDLKPGDLIFYSGTYYDPKKVLFHSSFKLLASKTKA